MKNSGKIALGLLAGLAAGAALGVLFAPKKGKETRKKLAGKAKEYGDAIKATANETGEMVADIRKDVRKHAEKIYNN
ncbi:MAG: YtxH domain-containing protein [Bacteroidetes bacterium]|nr:YtxH domain-containing protein [Bacteroidota bacterium]MBP7400550.1 YtxH domain-containing protein [Chitinophagales bacterium]MBK7108590.1 YtxH domain-containing protein [Bacteroidota bacterium]MBK8489084.1 YtxH domain-containing protein [Bacteroidota bacterium]MBK8680933.1 YtxH domain-containing protein [Bacteroidota bacterium]